MSAAAESPSTAAASIKAGGSITSAGLIQVELNAGWQISAGSTAVTSDFQIATFSSSNVNMTLSGTGSLNVGGTLYVGPAFSNSVAAGTFTQSGGTNTDTYLEVGNQSVGSGIYTLTNGSVVVGSYVGIGQAGTFNQSAGTVTIQTAVSGALYLTGTYNLSGTGDLKNGGEYVGDGASGTFHQTGGTQEISGYIVVAPTAGYNGLCRIDAGSVTTAGVSNGVPGSTAAFTLGSAANLSVGTFNNYGTATLSGSQTWTGSANFNNYAGVATFSSDAGTVAANLNLTDYSGTVILNSTQHLASLVINTGATVQATRPGTTPTVLFTWTLNSAGVLDLTTNDLDVTGGNLSAINTLAANGFAGGAWTGTGIASSTAMADPKHLTAIGVIQNNQDGPAVYSASNPFDGITPGASDILAKYTLYGDANLDGAVDGSDYTLIDAGFHSGGTLSGWYNGDFNYDGKIDGSDYTLIDNAFNNQGASLGSNPLSEVADTTAQFSSPQTGKISAVTAVPEPVSLAVYLMGGAWLLRRRPTVERKADRKVGKIF